MVSEHELRSYQGAEGRLWQSRNFVLGSMVAAALLLTALVGSTMEPQKPRADLADQSGISEISTSQKGSDTPFELMSRASKNLAVESWEPAY